MAKRLTDKKKKEILADYIEVQNYSEVARKYGVAVTTVKRIVLNDDDMLRKVTQKKEENTADILAYMDQKTISVKKFADYVLDTRLNPEHNAEELDNLSIPQLATVFGVVIDKALKAKEAGYKKPNEDNKEDDRVVILFNAADH